MKHRFKELTVWKRVRGLIKDIYILTENFPGDEKYGLKSQIQRAAISISLNIIEGSARSSNKQFANFLDIAFGSSTEREGILIHLYDVEIITNEQLESFSDETIQIQKMIYQLRQTILKQTE